MEPPFLLVYRPKDIMELPTARKASLTDRLPVTVQLGRTHIHPDDLANVGHGTLVVLDQTVAAPLDIYANGRLIARGEIVVVDEQFCVKITQLVTHVNEVA